MQSKESKCKHTLPVWDFALVVSTSSKPIPVLDEHPLRCHPQPRSWDERLQKDGHGRIDDECHPQCNVLVVDGGSVSGAWSVFQRSRRVFVAVNRTRFGVRGLLEGVEVEDSRGQPGTRRVAV